MTKHEFNEMLDSLAEGWSAANYDKVIRYFAEDVYYSDSLHYAFTDRAQLLEFFEDDDGAEQTCVFHSAVFDEHRQMGAAEYTYKGTHRYHGTVWIKLGGDLIVDWREYQHISDRSWDDFWKRVRKWPK